MPVVLILHLSWAPNDTGMLLEGARSPGFRTDSEFMEGSVEGERGGNPSLSSR